MREPRAVHRTRGGVWTSLRAERVWTIHVLPFSVACWRNKADVWVPLWSQLHGTWGRTQGRAARVPSAACPWQSSWSRPRHARDASVHGKGPRTAPPWIVHGVNHRHKKPCFCVRTPAPFQSFYRFLIHFSHYVFS